MYVLSYSSYIDKKIHSNVEKYIYLMYFNKHFRAFLSSVLVYSSKSTKNCTKPL